MSHDDNHHEQHPPGARSGPGADAGTGNTIDRFRITGDRTMQPRAHALRQAIMLALAGTALTLASVAGAQQRAFDIPATDAVAALPEYARQADVQIVAPGEQLRGLRTPAVKGTMDARAALRLLLADTGLHVAEADGYTITLNTVIPRDNRVASAGAVAQVVPPQSQPQPQPAPPAQVETESADVRNLDTVTVTGSFIRRIDTETALPVTTLVH